MKKHLDGLQACRAAAALLVVAYHNALIYFPIYTGMYDLKTQIRSGEPSFFDFGHAGVDFFFVLSGFIILWVHRQDIGRPDRFPRYFWRRTIRIYPTYWIVLALIVPIYFLRPDMGGGYERDPGVVLESFLLLPQGHLPIVPASWTLSHELLFYMIFSVLLFNLRAGLVLFGVWVIAIAYVAANGATFPLRFFGKSQNFEFFLGMAAAWYAQRGRIPKPFLVLIAGIFIFVGSGLLEVYTTCPIQQWDALTYGAGGMLIVLGMVGAERTGRLRIPSPVRVLGDASYSIYLIHTPLLSISARALRALDVPVVADGVPAFIGTIAVACAGGLALHFAVERPVLTRMGSRSRISGTPPIAAPVSP